MANLYTKKVWVNDQTKLSAKNLNHIENGIEAVADKIDTIEENIHGIGNEKQDLLVSGVNIQTINGKSILGPGNFKIEGHEHSNLEILEQIDTPFTQTLKDQFSEKSVVNASFDGTATDTVQYITIDGHEYKLAGGSGIPDYYERSNVSLDNILDSGVYRITNANKNPENTAKNGILNVTKLSNGTIEQKWCSTTNSAIRLLDPTESGPIFYVNNEQVEQGEIRLAAGGEYKLHGDLLGNIVIGTQNDSPANRTKIILDGVNIQSDEAESIINYAPKISKLIVEVSNNTENYLVCNINEEAGNDDLGVINSENNLMLTGVGYLTIINKKGHGIKASELIIDGDLHTYLDTNHDAVHGGKLLKITGGYFEVESANDAFSASSGSSGTGKLLIYGGTYIINNCKEAAFEDKSPNGVKRILNANITFGEGVNKLFNASNASSPAYQVKVYQGLNNINNNSGKTYTEVNMADDFTGAPTVVYADDINIQPDADGIFNLTAAGDYKLSGNFSNYRIVSNPAGEDKINLILDNVYYNNDTETEPFIKHISTLKRLKFDNNDSNFTGKLCYIRKANGNIIESGRNIQFDGKTDVIIDGCGTAGCGLYTPAGYVLLANDALRKVTGCEIGINADNVRLGKDPDDVLDRKYTTGDAEIYIKNNTTDILLTNQGIYENYHGLVIAPQYHTGISIIGAVEGEISTIEAQEGLIGEDGYLNSAILYLGSATGGELINTNAYEEPIGTISEVPTIEPAASRWTVYNGDGYTKEETDTNFVSKVDYDALKTELDNRAPKKIDIINYVEDSTKTDHRPAKEAAYSDGKIDAIEIFRYACPERIDIDSTVDQAGNKLEKPETHLSYFKDDRQIYARDGDFGYPEIDGTGQFNFRPVFNKNYKAGYVLQPVVTDSEDNPHDDKLNPCYNNFKTPYLTGIDNLYRFTKVCKDIKVDVQAVLESELPTNTITYKIVAPAGYDAAKIPSVRIFRCSDQAEKYYKYYLHPEKYETLNPDLMKGQVLEFIKQETAEGEDQVWEASGISYDDSTGYPSNEKAKVTFLVEADNLEDGYSATPSAAGKFKNLNAGDFGSTKVLTSITGAVTVTIRVAPPVEVSYDDQGYTRVDSKDKVLYGFDPEKTPASAAQYSPFRFTIIHGKEYAHSRTDETGTKIVIKDDDTDFTVTDAAALIDSIIIGGVPIDVLDNISITPLSFTKKKVTIELNGDVITDNVVIKLAAEAE